MNARSLAITRAVAVIGGTGALIVGATFAASNIGTVSLTGNTLSATAGLQIAPDNAGSPGTFDVTTTGFDFGSLAPGGAPSTKKQFWLKNTTGVDPVALEMTAGNLGPFTNLDKTKVIVHVEKHTGGADDSANVQTLFATGLNLSAANDPDTGGANTQYDVWVTLNSGALTGASVTNADNHFDLNFIGTE
jgi:hypothetical protein